MPYISPGDNPTETKAGTTEDNGISFKNYTNAKDGYNMHSSDILVVHGTDDGGVWTCCYCYFISSYFTYARIQ